MFKPSLLFRTDITPGRFLASPWTALFSLSVAIGVPLLAWGGLLKSATLPIWVLSAASAYWLISGALVMPTLLVWRWAAPNQALFATEKKGWQLFFVRESLALPALLALILTLNGLHQDQPFSEQDFQACTHGMEDAQLHALAVDLRRNPTMTRTEWAQACQAVRGKSRPKKNFDSAEQLLKWDSVRAEAPR